MKYIGDILLNSLDGKKPDKKNRKEIINCLKEVFQSTEAEELKAYLQRTDFNFNTKSVEITLAFPCK